jgi:hypothetical protein
MDIGSLILTADTPRHVGRCHGTGQRESPGVATNVPRPWIVVIRPRSRSTSIARYEAAHPDVEIICLSPAWQAIIREEAGQTIITRPSLGKLLDKLEALDQEQ